MELKILSSEKRSGQIWHHYQAIGLPFEVFTPSFFKYKSIEPKTKFSFDSVGGL
jgi:hypothetical protein